MSMIQALQLQNSAIFLASKDNLRPYWAFLQLSLGSPLESWLLPLYVSYTCCSSLLALVPFLSEISLVNDLEKWWHMFSSTFWSPIVCINWGEGLGAHNAMTPKGCWVTSVKVPSRDAIILWSIPGNEKLRNWLVTPLRIICIMFSHYRLEPS